MKIKLNRYLLIFIMTFLLLIFSCPAQEEETGNSKPQSPEKIVTLEGIKIGMTKEGVRVVLNLSAKTSYDIYSIKDSSVIYVDIHDCRMGENFELPDFKNDKLLEKIRVENYNPRMVRCEIFLKYGIPLDNFNEFYLSSPHRIVLDMERDYVNFTQYYITKNILWLQTEKAQEGRFLLLNEVYVNYKNENVDFRVEMAKNSGSAREKISDMVKRTGAIVGINGGYFSKEGENLGLIVNGGKILSPSVKRRPPRTAVGITSDREILFNRVSDKDDQLVPLWGKPWKNVVTALGGGPRLIAGGKVHLTIDEEELGKTGNNITYRSGRTFVGVSKNGYFTLGTVSGFKGNERDGMLLPEMADWLLTREMVDAMNLDGGGSTCMSILGYPVSNSVGMGNYIRPVANGLLVFDKSPVVSPVNMETEPDAVVLPADGTTTTTVKVRVMDGDNNPVPDNTAVRLASGVGLFENKNYLTKDGIAEIAVRSVQAPGNYSIKMECGPIRKFLPVKLQTGTPAFLTVDLQPVNPGNTDDKDKKGKKYIVNALVRDEFKNPLKSAGVTFEITEGEGNLSCGNCLTRENGVADSTLEIQKGTVKLRVSVEGLGSEELQLK